LKTQIVVVVIHSFVSIPFHKRKTQNAREIQLSKGIFLHIWKLHVKFQNVIFIPHWNHGSTSIIVIGRPLETLTIPKYAPNLVPSPFTHVSLGFLIVSNVLEINTCALEDTNWSRVIKSHYLDKESLHVMCHDMEGGIWV
jgi:hypothetical protein